MNDDKPTSESLGPIEYVSEVTESTHDHQYSQESVRVEPQVKEQKALSIFGLILALPFPILTVILWVTLDSLKGRPEVLGEHAMNAVFLYLVQFFVVPLLTLTSVIIAFIVTLKPQVIAKRIGYVSLGITGIGFIILGIFLNNS